jgi:Predicted ATPase
MQCPNCQTINPAQAKFCLECGYRLGSCPICGTLNPAGAKFCMECGHALQPMQATSATPTPEQSVDRGGEAQPLRVLPTPASYPVETTVDSTLERSLADPNSLLVATEERRVVTLMFADITGSTPLADRLDPEDMRAILNGYFNLMTEQIRKYDGTVEKYIGDAVMAVFGTPVTHEDDPERAIRAALDMQHALTMFNQQRMAYAPQVTRLQMRIGINTGEVAAPVNTATQHQDFLVTGDAVNIAARLQQNALPDTILVGERTYLATRDIFDFTGLAPLTLKGKPDPIKAYSVQGLHQQTTVISQPPRGISGHQTPLIGRDLELTLLFASYARVQAERCPHLITLLGVPGIGKTRLVQEFISCEQERVKNASAHKNTVAPLVLKGRCPPYGEGITYWPLVEILRSLLHVQANDTSQALQQRLVDFLQRIFARAQSSESAEEIADILIRRIGRGLINTAEMSPENTPILTAERARPEIATNAFSAEPKQSRGQGALLRAWRVILEALGKVQPLIIVVDDLQWADEALLDLLEYLTDRITAVPVLFLCPARPDFLEHRRNWGGGHRNFTTIELDALTEEESNELVDALLNTHDFPEALRYSILSRAEGNPFFVEEIVRMLIDQGILIREKDTHNGQDYWRVEYPRQALFEEPNNETSIEQNNQPEDGAMNSHFVLPIPYVPDTIQGVLAARVDLLEPVEKAILQHGAIIGRTFWLSLLIELATDMSPETILDGLVSLIRRDFIVENTTKATSPIANDHSYNFKHILIRDVVYNHIPRLRRAREHTHIALWMEQYTSPQSAELVELIAYHYQQALRAWSVSAPLEYIEAQTLQNQPEGPVRLTRNDLRLRAIKYLTITGDQALHGYYGLRALRAYNDASDLLAEGQTNPLERSRMLTKIAEAQTLRGNLDKAWQQNRRALQLATAEGTKPDRAYLLSIYEQLSLTATRWRPRFDSPPEPQEIRGYINAGLQLLAGTPISREYIAFLTYEAFWYIRQLDDAPSEEKEDLVEHALASGHRALSMAEKFDNPRMLSMTIDAMGFIYFVNHRYTRARELQDRRLDLVHLITDKEELCDLYYSLGSAHELVADYAGALSYYGQGYSYAMSMESPAMVLNTSIGRMRVWRRWNRWNEAAKVAHEILQFIDKYQQDEKRQLWALETLATIAYHRGQQERGDEYTRQLKRITDQQLASIKTPSLATNTQLHAIYLAQENWTHALSDYQEKVRRSEPFPDPEVLATLAELMVIMQQEGAMEVCDRAISLNESSGARKSLAVAWRARGRLFIAKHQWQEAETDLRQSLNMCEKLDIPWENAHTHYYLGQLYKCRAEQDTDNQIRESDLNLAHNYFERALGFYESLQALPAIKRTRAALRDGDTISTNS